MLSIYEMHDSTLDYFEELCVKDAMMEFKEKFPERPVHLYGARSWSNGDFSSADWFLKVAKKVFPIGSKEIRLDVEDILKLLSRDPWQKNDPHITVFFTAHELVDRDYKLCDGMTQGLNTVQSVFRFKELNPDIREKSIKTMMLQELERICDAVGDDNY